MTSQQLTVAIIACILLIAFYAVLHKKRDDQTEKQVHVSYVDRTGLFDPNNLDNIRTFELQETGSDEVTIHLTEAENDYTLIRTYDQADMLMERLYEAHPDWKQ